jgi:aspartokinase/homoserine dehydrogenase 1
MMTEQHRAGETRWRVHRFGGASVADAACMVRVVAAILKDDARPRVAAACRHATASPMPC